MGIHYADLHTAIVTNPEMLTTFYRWTVLLAISTAKKKKNEQCNSHLNSKFSSGADVRHIIH